MKRSDFMQQDSERLGKSSRKHASHNDRRNFCNRAANEELFNDFKRLEAMLENIQNLNPPGNMNTFSHYYSVYFNH